MAMSRSLKVLNDIIFYNNYCLQYCSNVYSLDAVCANHLYIIDIHVFECLQAKKKQKNKDAKKIDELSRSKLSFMRKQFRERDTDVYTTDDVACKIQSLSWSLSMFASNYLHVRLCKYVYETVLKYIQITQSVQYTLCTHSLVYTRECIKNNNSETKIFERLRIRLYIKNVTLACISSITESV